MIKQIDGQRFVTGNFDSLIYVYDIHTYALLHSLGDHTQSIAWIELLHNGWLMSATSVEIIWWNMTSYDQVRTFPNPIPSLNLERVRELADGSILIGYLSSSLYKYRFFENGSINQDFTWIDINSGGYFNQLLTTQTDILFFGQDHVRLINRSNNELYLTFDTLIQQDDIICLDIIESKNSYSLIRKN